MNESKVVPITFPKRLLKALRLVAAHQECSIASLVRISCAHYLYEGYRPLLEPQFIEALAKDLGLEV